MLDLAPIAPTEEQQRLEALARYDVLDTPGEEAFDRVTRLACRLLHVPIATVSFIDGHRLWYKSKLGISVAEVERKPAFCDLAIRSNRPLVINDTLADERFESSPFVTGAPNIRFYAGIPLRSQDGRNIGTLCAMDTQPRQLDGESLEVLEDLARIVMGEMELRLLATTDSLTGVLARRAFRDEADRAVVLALRHKHDLSLIAFDLDHFKAVNDTHGHAAGDEVLSCCAAACTQHLRKSDIVGRIGGEEFAVVLPHTGRAAALEVAEKLRASVAALGFEGVDESFSVTASFGVASLGRATEDLDTLLRHADEALYAAKASGRDRCLPWQPKEQELPRSGRRVLKAGQIVFNGGHSVIDCTVRRLSESGAGIDVVSSAGVPGRFKLRIEADDFSRICDVVQKVDGHLDVQFG